MKQDLFNSLSAGFNITPTQGEMDDFLTALSKNGLKLVSRTKWHQISELETNNKEYWLLDENNIVGVGHQEEGFSIVYNLDKTPLEFGRPEMFAEIKPPEVPRGE